MPSTNNDKRGLESETEEQRLSRTEEQRLSRLAKQRTRIKNNCANETSLETQRRRQRDREHHAQSVLQVRARLINEHLSSTVSHSQIDRPNSYISEENEASRKARNEDRRNSYRSKGAAVCKSN